MVLFMYIVDINLFCSVYLSFAFFTLGDQHHTEQGASMKFTNEHDFVVWQQD